jgi:hypothetical protein
MGARRGGVPRRIDRHRPIVVGLLVGWGPTVSVRRTAGAPRRAVGGRDLRALASSDVAWRASPCGAARASHVTRVVSAVWIERCC